MTDLDWPLLWDALKVLGAMGVLVWLFLVASADFVEWLSGTSYL